MSDFDFVKYANALGEASGALNQVNSLRELKAEAKEQKAGAFSSLEELAPVVTSQGLKSVLSTLVSKYGAPVLKEGIKSLGVSEENAQALVSGDIEGAVRGIGQDALQSLGVGEETASELAGGIASGDVSGLLRSATTLAQSQVEELVGSGRAAAEEGLEDAGSMLRGATVDVEGIASDLAAQEGQVAGMLSQFGNVTTGLVGRVGSLFGRVAAEPMEIELQDVTSGIVPDVSEGLAPTVSDVTGALSRIVTGASESIGGNIASTLAQTAGTAVETGLATGTAAAETGTALATGLASTAAEVGGEVAAGVTASAIGGAAAAALGPLGIIGGIIGAIVSAVKGTKEAKELKESEETEAQVVNPSAQFI